MNEPVRVAQVITRFMAGAGGVALRGALALDPARYDVHFIIGSGDRLVDEAKSAGFEVTTVPSLHAEVAPWRDLQALRDLTSVLATGSFDIVHTHSAKAGTLGRLAARRAHIQRVVHTFHGFPFHEFQSALRRSVYIGIERYLGTITDAILAVGPQIAAEAIRRSIALPERVRTIGVAVPLGPPPSTADRAEARRLLGVPLGMTVVGTVGRLDYQKAPEHFVEAVAQLNRPEVFAVWIGDGPQRSKIERMVAKRGLSERFALLGDRADVARLLPGLDIFAMASRYEGLPCAIVEAMAATRPVVATAVNSVPSIVVPGVTGLLVPPGRVELLSRAIAYLVDRPEVAACFGAAGRAALGREMTPSALGEILDATYRSLLDDRGVRSSRPLERVS
jgi:glycosyltransferase involved in cell wall biosynthesis